MTLEKMRSDFFWLLDRLKGNKIKNHYDEVSIINDSSSSAESIDFKKKSIDDLLNHEVLLYQISYW